MSKEQCEKCNQGEGTLYRFYYGKTLGTHRSAAPYNQVRVETSYHVGGYKDALLCDRCVRRNQMFQGVPLFVPIPFTLFLGLWFFFGENNHVAGIVILFIGVGMLAIWSLGFWLFLKFADKQESGDRAAREYLWGDIVSEGKGYDVYWTRRGYANQVSRNQKLFRE